MIDIEKFICSLLADHPVGVTVREDIHKALKDQGLEYKGGKIVPIEDKTTLQESEDERIRKYLSSFVELNSGVSLPPEEAKKILAWIEKQGEHANFRNKIQVGDKVTRNKDGVLVNLSQLNRVAKKDNKQGEQKPTDKVEPKFKIGDKIRRKTPSSYDKDMQVARIEKDYYICNHIGKFSSEVIPFSKESSYELVEPNPLWSEEDKRKIDRIYSILRQAADTHAFSTSCRLIGDKECIELQDFLKSLKDRVGCEADCTTMWKPRAEQMKALSDINLTGCVSYAEQEQELIDLYNDLKKLREE